MSASVSQTHFIDWLELQSARIKAGRPRAVCYSCARLAQDGPRKDRSSSAPLTSKRCRERALSNDRARRFGRVPRNEAEWQSQVNQILADWQSLPTDDDAAARAKGSLL
jgi:hypothetical protein